MSRTGEASGGPGPGPGGRTGGQVQSDDADDDVVETLPVEGGPQGLVLGIQKPYNSRSEFPAHDIRC